MARTAGQTEAKQLPARPAEACGQVSSSGSATAVTPGEDTGGRLHLAPGPWGRSERESRRRPRRRRRPRMGAAGFSATALAVHSGLLSQAGDRSQGVLPAGQHQPRRRPLRPRRTAASEAATDSQQGICQYVRATDRGYVAPYLSSLSPCRKDAHCKV